MSLAHRQNLLEGEQKTMETREQEYLQVKHAVDEAPAMMYSAMDHVL